MKKHKQKFPPSWNEAKVKQVIAHYENQTDDEALAEYEAGVAANDAAEKEAAKSKKNFTLMAIPNKLVPEVEKLLASKRSA